MGYRTQEIYADDILPQSKKKIKRNVQKTDSEQSKLDIINKRKSLFSRSVKDAINKLGGNFKPETEGITTDAWLQRVLEALAD